MKVIDFIINLLISPFTIVFKLKNNQGVRKEVKYIWVLLISLLILAVCILIAYHTELFKK